MTTAVLAGLLALSPGAAAPTAENAVMLTVFLKHDRSRPLSAQRAAAAPRILQGFPA